MAMAKRKKRTTKKKKKDFIPGLRGKIKAENLTSEWSYCDSALTSLRDTWTDNEEMFLNKTRGELAEETAKSNVNDAHLSTSIIQRTQRILAQPPTGTVKYLDGKNRGKGVLMNLILEKYIRPNANAQYPHLTKLKLWTIYSQVYGSMPMLVDYRVSDDYVGPDCWLIPIRQYYPQPDVAQVNDMDYAFVDNFVSVAWLKSRNKSVWFGRTSTSLLLR